MNSTSLTGFIAENETLEIVNDNFINPIKRTGAKIVTPPTKGNGIDFGAVGTAYDYWLRCAIKKGTKDIHKKFLGYRVCASNHSPEVIDELNKHEESFLKFSNAIESSNNKIMEACLFIAKFEIEYRSGYPVETFDVKSHNIEELERLAEATKLENFLNKETIRTYAKETFKLKGVSG
jgi:hypothetical protein